MSARVEAQSVLLELSRAVAIARCLQSYVEHDKNLGLGSAADLVLEDLIERLDGAHASLDDFLAELSRERLALTDAGAALRSKLAVVQPHRDDRAREAMAPEAE